LADTARSLMSLLGQRIDPHGNTHVDWRGVLLLAGPLIANNAIQAVLNLTDTWFVGRLSTDALAAVGAVQWLTLVAIMLFGGVGLAVQALVAQAIGSRRRARASQATWTGLWATLCVMPLFLIVAYSGAWLLKPFALDAHLEQLSLEFWQPRIAGGFLAVALWAVLGFFNGIGSTRIALAINALVGIANIGFNQLFIFEFNLGVAGAAWGTNCAMLLGIAAGLLLFLKPSTAKQFHSRTTWQLRMPLLIKQWKWGFPMGLMIAADVVGIALFQLMQVRVSSIAGATTQVVVMLTSIAYMPAVGMSLAGTTLVGQAIGANDKAWAYRIGNAVILLATGYMAVVGILLGLAGPWLLPLFVEANDPNAHAVISLGIQLIWIGGAYQMFDGLNIASGSCLRGAGDATIPAILVIALSWGLFVPVAHMLTFDQHHGWFDLLPQFGFGAMGGWFALLGYIVLLGLALLWRWRSRVWARA
jgi:multidrug resistance protein, MATE family